MRVVFANKLSQKQNARRSSWLISINLLQEDQTVKSLRQGRISSKESTFVQSKDRRTEANTTKARQCPELL